MDIYYNVVLCLDEGGSTIFLRVSFRVYYTRIHFLFVQRNIMFPALDAYTPRGYSPHNAVLHMALAY